MSNGYSPSNTENRYKGADTTVSLYPNSTQSKLGDCTLKEALSLLKSEDAKDATTQLRAMEYGKERDEFKKQNFKAATFSGVFPEVARRGELVEFRTGFVILDIDKLEPDRVREVRKAAAGQPFTVAAFVSPSGDGVKILVRMMLVPKNVKDDDNITAILEEHRLAFNFAADHYEYNLNVEVDPSGRDINRQCYLPYDPGAYINYDAMPMLMDTHLVKVCAALNNIHPDFDAEGDPYQNWLYCLMALHHSGSLKAKPSLSRAHRIANAWSMQSEKYSSEELDKKWHSFKFEAEKASVTSSFIRGLAAGRFLDLDALTKRSSSSMNFFTSKNVQTGKLSTVRCILTHYELTEDGEKVPYDPNTLFEEGKVQIENNVKVLDGRLFYANPRKLWEVADRTYKPLHQDLMAKGVCSYCCEQIAPRIMRFLQDRDKYEVPVRRPSVIHEGVIKVWEREGDGLVLRPAELGDNMMTPKQRDFLRVDSLQWRDEDGYPTIVQALLKDTWGMSESMIARARRWFARALTETLEQIPTFISGPGTGKGTLSRVLNLIYNPVAEISTKTDVFATENLYEAALSRVNEVEEFKASDWSDLLRMTDGETIPIRIMYQGWINAEVRTNYMFFGSDSPEGMAWGRGWDRRILNMVPLVNDYDLVRNRDIQEDFRLRMTKPEVIDELMRWIASEDFSVHIPFKDEETERLKVELMTASDTLAAFVHQSLETASPEDPGIPLSLIEAEAANYLKAPRGLTIRERRRLSTILGDFRYTMAPDDEGLMFVRARESDMYPWVK